MLGMQILMYIGIFAQKPVIKSGKEFKTSDGFFLNT